MSAIRTLLLKTAFGECIIANALIEEWWRSPEVPYFGGVAGNRIFAPLRQQSVPEKPRRDGFRATAKIRRCQGKLTHSLAHFHSCSK
jgi:hypothetical protein